jgi:hypothetical protein
MYVCMYIYIHIYKYISSLIGASSLSFVSKKKIHNLSWVSQELRRVTSSVDIKTRKLEMVTSAKTYGDQRNQKCIS